MPKNFKSGTPTRKTRKCVFPECDARPRGGKAFEYHMRTVHGITGTLDEFYREQFERYLMGMSSIYDKEGAP